MAMLRLAVFAAAAAAAQGAACGGLGECGSFSTAGLTSISVPVVYSVTYAGAFSSILASTARRARRGLPRSA